LGDIDCEIFNATALGVELGDIVDCDSAHFAS
jgi:hypothetical protein